MEKVDYYKLEFDVQASPGEAEVDSFFDWAKNHEHKMVKEDNGAELIRMVSTSGYQIVLIRPDEDHKASSYQPAIGKHMLVETHVIAPDNRPWVLSWVPGKEISVSELVLFFYEDVGYLLSLSVGGAEHGVFPVPEATLEEFTRIYDEELRIAAWD